jgi:hypothetical protein
MLGKKKRYSHLADMKRKVDGKLNVDECLTQSDAHPSLLSDS